MLVTRTGGPPRDASGNKDAGGTGKDNGAARERVPKMVFWNDIPPTDGGKQVEPGVCYCSSPVPHSLASIGGSLRRSIPISTLSFLRPKSSGLINQLPRIPWNVAVPEMAYRGGSPNSA